MQLSDGIVDKCKLPKVSVVAEAKLFLEKEFSKTMESSSKSPNKQSLNALMVLLTDLSYFLVKES